MNGRGRSFLALALVALLASLLLTPSALAHPGPAHRTTAQPPLHFDGDVNPNLPGGDGNGYYRSELSQTISAAFKAFPADRYAALYNRYLGVSRNISTTATCADWIPPDRVTAGSTLDRVLKRGVLRIGYVDASPYVYTDASGKLTGFEYDLANGLLELIQQRYPNYPLQLSWIPVSFSPSGSGTQNLDEASTLIQQLDDDAFDMVLSGIIAQPDRAIATSCPDMDFWFDAVYTGKNGLDLEPVQHTDLQTLESFLVANPGTSLVSTSGGPSQDTADAIAAAVQAAGGQISTATASANDLPNIMAQEQYSFVIGDGNALSSSVLNFTGFGGLNLYISVYTGDPSYDAPFTQLEPVPSK